ARPPFGRTRPCPGRPLSLALRVENHLACGRVPSRSERRTAVRWCGRWGSDVPLEDARLREPRQTLADCPGAALAVALHGLQIVDAGGEELLQAPEGLDESVDHRAGQPRHLRQQAVTPRADGRV